MIDLLKCESLDDNTYRDIETLIEKYNGVCFMLRKAQQMNNLYIDEIEALKEEIECLKRATVQLVTQTDNPPQYN